MLYLAVVNKSVFEITNRPEAMLLVCWRYEEIVRLHLWHKTLAREECFDAAVDISRLLFLLSITKLGFPTDPPAAIIEMSTASPRNHPKSPSSPPPLPPTSPGRPPGSDLGSLSRSNSGAYSRPPSLASGVLSSQSSQLSHEARSFNRSTPLSTSSRSAKTLDPMKSSSRSRKRRRTAEEEEVALGHSLSGTSSEKLYTFDKKLGEGTFGFVLLLVLYL